MQCAFYLVSKFCKQFYTLIKPLTYLRILIMDLILLIHVSHICYKIACIITNIKVVLIQTTNKIAHQKSQSANIY